MKKNGKVILVGAGPGDPGLITVRGQEAIASADVIVYDYLANEELLSLAQAKAEKLYVGKQGASHSMEQGAINDLLYTLAASGKTVVRLKGGDPYIFGRGAEEVSYCRQRGMTFEVVPGIPAAIGAAAYAGIPLTDRRLSSSVAFVTGHEDPLKNGSSINWQHLATGVDTIVFYMGMSTLAHIMEKLIEHGRSPDTPVSIVQWATMPEQRVIEATVSTIAEIVKRENITPPALSIVGKTSSLRKSLDWFGRQPLIGKRVIVTRSREQASTLVRALRALRAQTLELPMLAFSKPDSWDRVDQAISCIHEYDWVFFTSANGVDFFFDRMRENGVDARRFHNAKIAAIGPATAVKLADRGIIADFQPTRFTTEALCDEFKNAHECSGRKLLLLRADIAEKAFRQRLISHGALVDDVVTYKTLPAQVDADRLRAFIAPEGHFCATFASSSTVRNFFDVIRNSSLEGVKERMLSFSIGPKTSDTIRSYGIEPTAEASESTIPGLVDTMVKYFSRNQGD